MSGRHRGHLGLGRFGTPVTVAGIIALVAIGAVAVGIVAANAAGCRGTVPLRVVASPDIAPTLKEIGSAWAATRPQVSGTCVALTVDAVASPTVASGLTVFGGRGIDVAAPPEPTPPADALPSVWVPDSSAWLTRVAAVDRSAFEQEARSIASSPVVIAMPEADAKLIGWPSGRLRVAAMRSMLAPGGPLKLGIADPRRDTAGLAATMQLASALTPSDEDLPALVKTLRGVVKTSSTDELVRMFGDRVNAGPVSEQAVLAYDVRNPAQRLVAVQLDPATALLDYPYAIRSAISREVAQAAHLFRQAVLDAAALEVLARAAFRGPDGQVGAGFPSSTAAAAGPFSGAIPDDGARVQRALGVWSAANSPSRTLALFDVTSSMGTLVRSPRSAATRAQIMVAAATEGLGLFQAESRVGMWTFGAAHQEILPIDDLTPQRRSELERRMAGVRPAGAGGVRPSGAGRSSGADRSSAADRSELYATLLAAYAAMKDGYDASRPNIIVVFTDGGDSDRSAVRRERFKQDLQRLADPTKPIRVVLVGVGVGQSDAAALQEIAGIVGGGFFPLTSPEQIQTIFLRALLLSS